MIIDRRDASDEQTRWYLGGRQFYSVSESRVGPAAFDRGFSILPDVAVGGVPGIQCGCTAPDNQTSSQGTMVVPWLNVYTNRRSPTQDFLPVAIDHRRILEPIEDHANRPLA